MVCGQSGMRCSFASGLRKVGGQATLASGSTVVINAKGADFAKGGATYALISAQNLNIAADVAIESSSNTAAFHTPSLQPLVFMSDRRRSPHIPKLSAVLGIGING